MSSHPYVSQLNTPLDDDTTLMSTTDLESYITHANDTFVQVSGYQLNELLAQPHNLVRHPDMPKAAFADMWYTLKQGEPWSGIVAQVQNVTLLIARISQSTQEQTDGLSSLTRAVDELNRITQKNAALVEESAQVSAMVKHRASRLEDAVTVLH